MKWTPGPSKSLTHFSICVKSFMNDLLLAAVLVPKLYYNLLGVSLGTITRSVNCKFNCITVNFDKTQHGSYLIWNFIVSITKKYIGNVFSHLPGFVYPGPPGENQMAYHQTTVLLFKLNQFLCTYYCRNLEKTQQNKMAYECGLKF